MRDLLAGLVGRIMSVASRPRPPADADQRAEWDARTLVRLLDREQLRRYAETDDTEVAVELIARERRAAWEQRGQLRATPEEREVLLREWRWAGTAELALRAMRGITLVSGWTFLLAGLVGVLGVHWLIWVSAAALLVGTLSLSGYWVTMGIIDRLRIGPVLDWASRIPGQLGRGLPGSTPTSTVSGALDLIIYILTVILAGSAFGLFLIGLLVIAIELFFWALDGLAPTDMGFSATMLGIGLAVGLVALGLNAAWGAMVQADRRRVSATQWLVER